MRLAIIGIFRIVAAGGGAKALSGKIASIDPGSPAARARIHVGETLLSINGKTIKDVLDYRFYAYDPALTLVLRRPDGAERTVHIRKEEGEDIGLNRNSLDLTAIVVAAFRAHSVGHMQRAAL